jgi:hypothetical protein
LAGILLFSIGDGALEGVWAGGMRRVHVGRDVVRFLGNWDGWDEMGGRPDARGGEAGVMAEGFAQ